MASRYRTCPYDRLVEELLDKPTIAEVTGKSGASYQVDVDGFWDSGRPRDLRVMVPPTRSRTRRAAEQCR